MKRSLKREVDDMGDLESPGGPPVPEAGVEIRSFPEADRVWGYGGGGQPRLPERREVGQQGREVRTQAPSELGASLQARWSLNSTEMVAGSSICKFLTP